MGRYVMSVLTAVLSAGMLAACDESGTGRKADLGPDVPRLETPEWSAPGGIPVDPPPYPSISLRYDRYDPGAGSDGREVLLLKHSEQEAVYAYDPNAEVLALVSGERWAAATGKIADCGKPPFQPRGDILHRRDSMGSGLFAGDREIETAGEVALWLRLSPGGTKVAVLSGDGRRTGTPFMPMISGGGATGQRYHEVLSLPGADRIRRPRRLLDRATHESSGKICWAADERYVVYVASGSSHIAIVHLNEENEETGS